jgi:hypothetical protein
MIFVFKPGLYIKVVLVEPSKLALTLFTSTVNSVPISGRGDEYYNLDTYPDNVPQRPQRVVYLLTLITFA